MKHLGCRKFYIKKANKTIKSNQKIGAYFPVVLIFEGTYFQRNTLLCIADFLNLNTGGSKNATRTIEAALFCRSRKLSEKIKCLIALDSTPHSYKLWKIPENPLCTILE